MFEAPVKLIVLDINLPQKNGFSFCEKLRQGTEVPLIFISARTSDTDKVNALMLGGDDYLAKPYSLVELYSRIVALMRRTYGYGTKGKTIFGDVVIDRDKRSVKKAGAKLDMTAKMYDFLIYFVMHPGEVHFCIAVSDHGLGIPEEDILYARQKFYRGGNALNQQRAGLGLYISEVLMKQMKGSLELRNREGLEVSLFLRKTEEI